MPITDLSDEELKSLYKPQNEQSSGISSVSDEELLNMYNQNNSENTKVLTGGVKKNVINYNYDDIINNPNLSKEQKVAGIKKRSEEINKQIDREHRKQMAKLYGGALFEIGSAAIPVGAGLRLGGLALKVGKPIAQQVIRNLATRGAIEGGLSGLVGGVGRGMVEDKDLKGIGQTALTDAGIGLIGGAGLASIGGKIATNVGKTGQRIKNIEAKQKIPLAERMTEEQLQNVKQPEITQQVVEEVTEQPKTNLNTLKSNIRANKFEQSNMKNYYVVGKGKKGYKSTLADPISRDTELSQREFNKIITEISKNPEKLNDSAYINELENRVQKIIDNTPYGNEDEVAMPYWEKLWKAVDDGYSYNDFKANKGKIKQPIEQPTGETKLRSLPQSVLEAKGTPKEVKEIIKQDMPTYQVLHNKDLTAQASNELAGNFDNELVRLASAKDFNALDYEKSRQIAKTLFDNGDYQRAVDLIDNVSENATKKGQAIQALSLWSNMSPEGAVYKAQKLVKEYNKKNPKKPIQLTDENIDTIRKLQSEALNTADELERNQAMARSAKYMTDLIPKGFVKKLKAYRNIAMLLNPKTLGRNIVGNVVFNVTDTGSKGLAALIDRGLSKFTGQRTRVAPDLGAYGKGLVQGTKTGFKEALQGIDTRGLGQRYDLGSGRVFESKPMQALETALDVGLRTPDRAFYEATFAESVQNMMKAQGLKEPTQEILERAEQEALESVFQNKSNISDLALGLRSGFNKIGTQDFGLGDVLIPYAQTPANLTQQAINYSPLGLIKGGINLSKDDQRQASLDIARSLIGSGLIGGGYGLAKAGLITPSQFDENYTRNKAIRENLQPLGIRPDQLGNMWYAPFQPMSSPIATGTAMAYGDNPIFAGLNTVVDQPYLQGVTKGLRDLQEGNWADAGINVASSIPSQFVPTLASQFAQSIDPYQRQTYDPNKLQYGLNSAIAKIPFASKTLPERIDVTGQPIERYSSKGAKRLYDIFLNPTFINKKTDDPVLSELKYIYDQTKETKHFMPTVNKTLSFTDVDGNKQKIKLTGRELSEYQRELGQRMYDEFNYVMDLPEYTNTDDYGKIELLEKAKKLVKDEVDNEIWNKKKQYKKSSYTKGI